MKNPITTLVLVMLSLTMLASCDDNTSCRDPEKYDVPQCGISFVR